MIATKRALLAVLMLSLCQLMAPAADAKKKARAPAKVTKVTCNAQCLRGQMDQYLNALIKHQPAAVKRAKALRFTENGTSGKLGDGLWKKASSLGAYRQVLVDNLSQQAMFIGIVNEGDQPAIVSLRLGFDNGALVEVEHVVARKGSYERFAPQAFVTAPDMLSASVAQDDRLPRARMTSMANAYFDAIQKHSGKLLKAAPQCRRLENGVRPATTSGAALEGDCQNSVEQLSDVQSIDNRRFPIVDVDRGIVVATVLFDIPAAAATPQPAPTASDGSSVATTAAEQNVAQNTPDDASSANTSKASTPPTQPGHAARTLLLTQWFKIDHGAIQHIEAIVHELPHGSPSGWEIED